MQDSSFLEGKIMKPLSTDLRERLVRAVLAEGMTCNAVAVRFDVSHSAVIKIVRRFDETGDIGPMKVGGRKPILFQCYDMVRAIIEDAPDLTLAKIADEIVARGGPRVGKSSVDRTLAHLGLRFKKKV
jgi:transposase